MSSENEQMIFHFDALVNELVVNEKYEKISQPNL